LVQAIADDGTGASHAEIRQSAIVRQPDYGVFVHHSSITLESTLVRDNVQSLRHSAGVLIESSDATIRYTEISRHPHTGLHVLSSNAVLEASVVRDVSPLSDAGYCLSVLQLFDMPVHPRSDLTIRASLIEDCVEMAVIVEESNLAIEASILRNVAASADGILGDGVAVVSTERDRGTLQLTGAQIENVARAGVSAFGGEVAIGFSSVSCAAFGLAGEELEGIGHSYEKTGDNLCGCPEAADLCEVESPGIGAPEVH
jgi:hypothetical protein